GCWGICGGGGWVRGRAPRSCVPRCWSWYAECCSSPVCVALPPRAVRVLRPGVRGQPGAEARRFPTLEAAMKSLVPVFLVPVLLATPALAADSPSTRDLSDINWMELKDVVPAKINTVILPTGTLEPHGV